MLETVVANCLHTTHKTTQSEAIRQLVTVSRLQHSHISADIILSCRECCERLTAARRVLAGPSGTLPYSVNSSPEYKLAAQRVERCLSILERFAEQCQVRLCYNIYSQRYIAGP